MAPKRNKSGRKGAPDSAFLQGDEAFEDPMEFVDTENNPGELIIALRNIRRAMERRGLSYEQAARRHGIPGHPHFKDYWPVTRYWGDARWARERLGLPLDEEPES